MTKGWRVPKSLKVLKGGLGGQRESNGSMRSSVEGRGGCRGEGREGGGS